MARQTGEIKIVGSFDDICFYKMGGEYFARMKSSLDSKRFWKDMAFERSRKSSEDFGKANKLASKVYRSIEKNKRDYSLFSLLKTEAIALIKERLSDEEVISGLQQYLPKEEKISIVKRRNKRKKSSKRKPVYIDAYTSLFILPAYNLYKRKDKVYGPV
jgi:hypothetical protein